MKLKSDGLDLSASDLSNFLSCHHSTALDLAVERGERSRATGFNPMAAAMRERGLEHERRYVDALRSKGLEVVDLSDARGDEALQATKVAMTRGADVIVQAALRRGVWNGRADVLLRVPQPSTLGAWSYEPIDTKLSRETRASSVLQLALYAELLSGLQGRVPERFCVVVPGREPQSFVDEWYRTDNFHAYFRFVREQLEQATDVQASAVEQATYPEPVEHCDVCKWWQDCDKRRRDDDHLALVAGATRLQRRELKAHDIVTLAQLAKLPVPLQFKPERGSRASIERVREQARVQLEGREANKSVYELLPIEAGQGLARLPAPSPGDVFFDLEGDPFAGNGGREYLFGMAWRDDKGVPVYRAYWARNASEERQAFETVVDFFAKRAIEHPGFHVYHYAPYEPAALKRLMGRYATREAEVDALLRAERFVDLYRVVRQGVRASVERYSIKDLETFYKFERKAELRLASQSLRTVEQAIEAGDWSSLTDEVKTTVETYNREDCVSALHLRDWLEQLRASLAQRGETLERPAPKPEAPSEDLAERIANVRAVMDRLTAGVPDDIKERTEEQQARWLLAQLLEFHRREAKSEWWEFYRLCALNDDELLDERPALAQLTWKERLPPASARKKTPVDRYAYPLQDCDISVGDSLKLPGEGAPFGKVVAIDRAARTIDINKRMDQAENHPTAVFAHDTVSTKDQEASLLKLGTWVADNGIDAPGQYRAARDLLLRRRPRLRSGQLDTSLDPLSMARRAVTNLDASVLPIQGPPGAGKTYTAARMICDLVRDGRKVGISANSHKVIHKLLEEVATAAREQRMRVRSLAKVTDLIDDDNLPFEQTEKAAKVFVGLDEGEVDVAAGTPWLWSMADAEESVDVLFVDEAGQMALANVLAIAPAAESLVLIGDPQQLEQPQKGSHPDGAGASALEHLFGGSSTVPEGAGVFLAETWRLAPAICTFTSELFYENRLQPHEGLEQQVLRGTDGFDGAGLWYVPVQHEGNPNASPEEAQAVAKIVKQLLTTNATWVDRHGKSQRLRGEHILVVAPYNAHVALLSEHIADESVRVATVDKFQGQEAPVVIYSMATSTPDEAPRGMEFLYSLNRLNVATSRARCACILVASPALFEPECRTVRHVQLANAFCRYRELARVVEPLLRAGLH